MKCRFLDTGAMYRGVAYAYQREQPTDLDHFLSGLSLTFSFNATTSVFLNGEDVSEKIRTPEISLLASSLSQDSRVRAYLTKLQQQEGERGSIVAEGRDTGSVVFPDADVKFYLDADVAERARRRYAELAAGDSRIDREKVREELERRDKADSERDLAPLICPKDARYVDTTGKSIDEVVDALKELVLELVN